MTDLKGRTPLQLALENDKKNIVEMLSNIHKQDQITLTTPPFTNQSGNCYFNVVLFVILHLVCGSLVLFILLPCKNIYLKYFSFRQSNITFCVYSYFLYLNGIIRNSCVH